MKWNRSVYSRKPVKSWIRLSIAEMNKDTKCINLLILLLISRVYQNLSFLQVLLLKEENVAEDSLYIDCLKSLRVSEAQFEIDYIRTDSIYNNLKYDRLQPCDAAMTKVTWIKVTDFNVTDFRSCASYAMTNGKMSP